MTRHLFLLMVCSPFIWGPSFAFPRPSNDLASWTRPQISGLEEKKRLTVGMSIMDVKTGEVLLQHHADQLMKPASILKLVTSFSSLSRLGPNFTFNTELKTTGRLEGGKLTGDLYLVGSGDPLFVSERMWLFANAIERLGIKTFSGTLTIDDTLFESMTVDERQIDGADQRAYNAPLSPLSFNFNTTTIVVRPSVDGTTALVNVDPPNSYVTLKNSVKIIPGKNRALETQYVSGSTEGEVYTLKGTIGRDAGEVKLYRSLRHPPYYFARVLRDFLAERGVQLSGKVKMGKAPESAQTLLSFESLPLHQIIDGLNKFSNNFVADQILLTLASRTTKQKGTFALGEKVVLETLKEHGINPKGIQMDNGSGLSHHIRITPNQITQVLQSAYRNLSWGPYFVSSLPTSGIDGTLKDRFKREDYFARVKAKTGSVAGVASLAGYIQTKDGDILAVTSILNSPNGSMGDLRDWQDGLFKRLMDWE